MRYFFIAIVTTIGSKPVPVDLTLHYTDGTKASFHRSIGIWEKGMKSTTLSLTATKPVSKLVLGHPHTADSNLKKNQYLFSPSH